MRAEVSRYADRAQMAGAAAEIVAEAARASVRERGVFHLVLSGGSTPRPLYERLAAEPYRSGLPWSATHFFWTDERCVPPDDPLSNYRLARETLLEPLEAAPEHVHRLPGEVRSPEEGAAQAERELQRMFHVKHSLRSEPPVFDLILLGLGADGHTASLFPGSPLLEERGRWVAAERVPQGDPPLPRLTLTLPVINAAREVVFLVAGEGKRQAVEAILESLERAAATYPAARVQPRGRLRWLLCLIEGAEPETAGRQQKGRAPGERRR